MSDIFLIRHGQASFGAADYDELSELGWRQGRATGESLRHIGGIDHVACGQLRRHRDTWAAFAEGFGEVPEARLDAGWNEYDHDDVLTGALEQWRDPDERMRWLAAQEDPRGAFHELFERAAARWIGGEHAAEYAESFEAFCARTQEALARLRGALGSGKTALVFTSGGVISALAVEILGAPPESMAQLNLVMQNASLTHLLSSGSRRSLVSLNSTWHLAARDPELVTYR